MNFDIRLNLAKTALEKVFLQKNKLLRISKAQVSDAKAEKNQKMLAKEFYFS